MERNEPLNPDALVAHGAFVLSLARGLTRDESSALDLRQDAMVTALQSPPGDRSVRGWFSTVLRSRKVEQDRSSAARRRREDAVAKPEASLHDSAAPLEQLELNHSVVRAVLDLDEPYRSVVVDVYFDGLTPEQIARRRGAKAGTVRSQLCRAHDQLRAKLDDEYRQRSLWAVPLAGLLEAESKAVAAAAKGGAMVAGAWSTLALAATVVLMGGLLFVLLRTEAPVPQGEVDGGIAQTAEPDRQSANSVALVLPPLAAPTNGRRSIAVPSGGVASATSSLPHLEELPSLLGRVRALRTLILQRAMAIDLETEERFAWLGEEGGVVRLLNRERYGSNWSLPWMRGGGGFYSFLVRSQDSKDRMQVSLMGDRLILEAFQNAVLSLGQTNLASVPNRPVWSGDALSQADAIEFDVVWADRGSGLRGLRGLRSLKDLRKEIIDAARQRGDLDGAVAPKSNRIEKFVEPEVGSTYLLRSVEENRMDTLVAFEILALDEEGCTLAWRMLKQWPTEVTLTRHGDRAGSMTAASVSNDLSGLAERSDEELRSELDAAIETAQRGLFDFHGDEIEDSYGSLRDVEGSGLARLLIAEGPWSELKSGNGHGASISPISGSHGEENPYLAYRGEAGSGELMPGHDGTPGLVCDLGAVALAQATQPSLPARVAVQGREKGSIALDRWFGFAPPPPGDPNEADFEADRYWLALRRKLSAQLNEAGVSAYADAKEGHTYLVRSAHHDERNLLFAVHVVAIDPYGVIVTWRVLDDSDAWPYR